ncbi:F0F1 ATP synthase subunit B [Roseospira marina]|uniref:ATP synthase subunit b n=1 Tax=Roseospira marina TaxID=140057 RepID=A0A5M6IF09_9PROT|nr:F0F1 ATP synthase subunit B [Roseospira marina]MBB4314047.1 F-type H+-transporting ATPase subunit b [Roseospira marina]MBB5087208.1 F-type H+-transporting ATPase subunit b [Roseospira marina]
MFQAIAAETAAHGAEAAAHGAEHAGGFFAEAESWVLVAFVLVVAFVIVKARTRVLDALDGRAARIRGKLDEARTLREEAQALLAEYELKQREALNTAKEIVEHARSETERMRKQAADDLEDAIARRERQAEERIAQAEAQAVREVRAHVVDVAVAAAERVIAERMDERHQATLVDAAIDDLPRRLH